MRVPVQRGGEGDYPEQEQPVIDPTAGHGRPSTGPAWFMATPAWFLAAAARFLAGAFWLLAASVWLRGRRHDTPGR